MRKHTPEELAAAERILKEAQPLFEQRNIREQAEQERFAAEIAMLERRILDEHVELELSGGDVLLLRTCLSETESGKLGELYKKWFSPLKNPDKNAIASRKNVAYEIIALTTANPIITVAWLKKNPDRFSTDDAANMILSWAEKRQVRENERAVRLVDAISFRPKPAGAELRGLPASDENPGPKGVGSPPG